MRNGLRWRAVFVLVVLLAGMLVSVLASTGAEVFAASPAAEVAKGGGVAAKGEANAGEEGAGLKAKGDGVEEAKAGEVEEGAGSEAKGEAEKEPAKEITTHQKVYVGAYLNDIQTIDLKTHTYAVDLYVWFRWSSPDFDPATSFEFINSNESWGHVREANWEEPRVLKDGSRYQVVHAQGKFSRKFLLYNYPFDRQTIEVSFEDSVLDSKLLTYVADAEGFTVNPALVLPGYRSEAPELVIADRQYPTKFGEPERAEPESYSRVSLQLPIRRPRDTYMIKLLLPVLCTVVCASLMFLIRPSYVDARMTIGITALLTIVALQITLNSDMPDVDYLVLMDKIYVCAYLFVIVGLLVVVKATRLLGEGNEEAAVRLDRRAMRVLLALFMAASLVLVLLAMSRG